MLIELTQAHVVFGSTPILRDLSLTLVSGETVALLGANGSGKTTLLRLLAGEISPHRGSVRIAPSLRPAYVDPNSPFPLALTGREACDCAAALFNLTDQRLSLWLDHFKVAGLERPLRVLSRGQRARLELALAWAEGPPLLLLDEPLTALDTETRRSLADALSLRRTEGLSTVLATHETVSLESALTRTIRLHQGRAVH